MNEIFGLKSILKFHLDQAKFSFSDRFSFYIVSALYLDTVHVVANSHFVLCHDSIKPWLVRASLLTVGGMCALGQLQ